MENHKIFKAELISLHDMLEWVRERLKKTTFSDAEIRRIEIALEEGLVNIISYAYQEKGGMIEIVFHHERGNYVELTIIDSGLPFNPLKHKREVNSSVPIEDLKEGGLGIVFMQKIMDVVKYKWHRGKNTLTLRKNLS